MNFRSLIALSLAGVLLASSAHAVKVDMPGQAEKESSHILTGTVTAIYAKVVREPKREWTHCVAAIRVESVEKGDGVKIGELIYVRYIGGVRWLSRGTPEIGPAGHENVPREGDRRKVCLTRGRDGAFDVYYVSGFKKP